MKIIMIGLSSVYTEKMSYQDNQLSKAFADMGHDVLFVSNNQKFDNGHNIVYTGEETVYDGKVQITRIKYKKIINNFFSEKIRKVNRLYSIIETFNPDIIYVHGMNTVELRTIKKYILRNKKCLFIADTHADKHNSAQNFISKWILHRIFYKRLIKATYKYLDKIFYVSTETKDFLKEMYNLKEDKLEYLPLGGDFVELKELYVIRNNKRKELKISDNEILIVHSGKINKQKNTEVLLHALSKLKSRRLKLIIIGSIEEGLKNHLLKKIESDSRVKYLGWRKNDEIADILAATDIYCQPGTQSATLHNAASAMCSLMIRPYQSYMDLYGDTPFYINDEKDIINHLKNILDQPQLLEKNKSDIYHIAQLKLDYKKQVERIIQLYEIKQKL